MTRAVLIFLAILNLPAGALAEVPDPWPSGAQGKVAQPPPFTGETASIEALTGVIDSGALSRRALAAAYNNRAIAFGADERDPQALADYAVALALDPSDGLLRFNRARVHLRRGEQAAAIEDLDAALRLAPDTAALHYNLGLAHWAAGHTEAALASLRQAVDLAPDMAMAVTARGQALALLGRHAAAVAALTAAIGIDPTSAAAHRGRGYARSGLGRHDLAVADYSTAITLGPNNPAAFKGRAEALRLLGQFERALDDYDTAIALQPADGATHFGLGLALKALGRFGDADKDFGRAIALLSDKAMAYKSRATTRFYLGQFPEAARDLRQALRLDPRDAYAMLWLHLARERAGLSGARELAAKRRMLAATAWPQPVIALFLGEASTDEVLRQARHPNSRKHRERECEAFFYVGQYKLLAGDSAGAARAFRRALQTAITTYAEYRGAEIELQKLDNEDRS